MKIQFDSTNLLASIVGEADGLTPPEIKKYAPMAHNALRAFQTLSEEGQVGFPHLPFQDRITKDILAFTRKVRGSYDTVCVVGIGGSALGASAIDMAMRGPQSVQGAYSTRRPRLIVLDNIDPDFIAAALAAMDRKQTLVLVVGKSGGTAETAATFLILREWLGRKANQRIVAITSAEKGDLAELAVSEQYPTFVIPENVGGRFSVLSPVGLVPAALTGIDIRKLLRGAADITHWCWKPDIKKNIALRAALFHYLIWTLRKKTIQVAFPYSNRLWATAFWFRQLWAESLGKSHLKSGEDVHVGQTLVAALGTTDQHSQVQLYIEGPKDKVFTFWTIENPDTIGKIPKKRLGIKAFDYLAGKSLADLLDAEQKSTMAALSEAGRPNCSFILDRMDEEHLGAFFQLLEFETAFMGELLEVNAFDQPGVELGKQFTFGLMGRDGFESYRKRFEEYEKARKKAG